MKHLRFFAVILAAVLLIAPAVHAQEDLGAILKKANALYKEGNYEGTITELRKALEILKQGKNLPGAQQIQMNIGINYIKLEKYNEAVKELEEAKALNPKPDPKIDLRLNTVLATAHYNLGHYALRAGILEDLLKRYKTIDEETLADMYAQLGDSYRRNEIHSKAIAAYGKALSLFTKLKKDDKRALVMTAMGLSQIAIADYDGAVKNLGDALTLAQSLDNPRNTAESHSNLGIAFWNKGEYPKALESISSAKQVEMDSNLKQNLGADFNNEGLVYKSVGNYPKALEGFEESIKIAKEIGDKRSEAIALANKALVLRIQGKNVEALSGYLAALKLYEEVNFKEGMANCHMGLGKLYEVQEKNYKKAYDSYQKALALFKDLDNLAFQAEALNQIGRCLRATIDPKRASRDLVFEEEEPETLQMTPDEAKEKSLAAYQEALELAKTTGKKEAIWSAEQGIGFALAAQGKEEEAFKYYQSAIDTVMGMKAGGDSDLMANYLNDKEDLFDQAIELCTSLFNKTKKDEYRKLMMQYQEIYKNEVMKVAMNGAQIEYKDANKESLFKKLNSALNEKTKLDDLLAGYKSKLTAKVDEKSPDAAEVKQLKADLTDEQKTVVQKAKKLEQTISQLLKQWKQKYPNDAPMFETAAQLDMRKIQRGLGPDKALVQYFPLQDKLSILVVTDKEIAGAEVAISYKELAALIRDTFNHDVIELYGHQKTDMTEEEAFKFANETMNKLYKVLLAPVADKVKDKEKLIIVPSKYVAYVPFSALVTGYDDGDKPHFLIYDKTVSYIRLSFFSRIYSNRKRPKFSQNKMLAVGNPTHQYLKTGLPDLPGAEKEIKNAVSVAEDKKMANVDMMLKEQASESDWKSKVEKGGYTIYYFATHGVPYAEIMQTRIMIGKMIKKYEKRVASATDDAKKAKAQKRLEAFQGFADFYDDTFMSKSPLNGFLYMTYADGNVTDDGVLTLKEIMELPDSAFKSANLAILSACNTAVTYSPMVSAKTRQSLESAQASKELLAAGFTPGVDQVSLTDTFMRRNFNSVMGTLWFADDAATGFIIARFFENLVDNAPAEALRKAKLQYLENPPMGSDYTKVPRHPYYWAVSAMFGE